MDNYFLKANDPEQYYCPDIEIGENQIKKEQYKMQ